MAITRTLAQLRNEMLIAAGMNTTGTSVDLTADVLNGIVNNAVAEGWDVIVNKWLDYATGLTDLAVVSGTDTYALPTDFYKARVVWLAADDRWARLRPVDLDAAHLYTGTSVGAGRGYRYRITNRNLVLMPVPSSSETVRVFYVPIKQEMANDDDQLTFDVPIELKYVIAIGWRDILDRQNLDPSPAIAKVQLYEAKLRTSADSLDAGEPFYLDARGGPDDDSEVW